MSADMHSFRKQFIKELAMELCGACDINNKRQQKTFETILRNRLPQATEVMFPTGTITLED